VIASAGRIGAAPGAVRLTGLILLAALTRSWLEPVGEGVSTTVFAALLLLAVVPASSTPQPSPSIGGRGGDGANYEWTAARSLLGGLVVAALIVAPGLLQPAGAGFHSGRGLDGWWPWAAVTALVATVEEVAIRGALQGALTRAAGTLPAIAGGAAVFALIHLPRYGAASLPLDLAVGIALGALRALSGRVLPCAVAHTLADWAAWWMP